MKTKILVFVTFWVGVLQSQPFHDFHDISNSLTHASSVYASDLDGDGDIDVISSYSSDSIIAWCENMGGGVFSEGLVITNQAAGASSVCASDLDGDGDIDVLSASGIDDKIAWYENLNYSSIVKNNIEEFISAYPNPANNIINLEFEVAAKRKIIVYSPTGKILQNKLSTEAKYVLNLSSLKRGMYIVKIKNENDLSTIKKIIKE